MLLWYSLFMTIFVILGQSRTPFLANISTNFVEKIFEFIMTNFYLYVNIYIMNKTKSFNKKFLILFCLILGSFFCFTAFLLTNKTALGESSSTTQLEKNDVAPISDALVFDVTTPVDALSFGDYLAVIKKDETSKRTLWISTDGKAFVEYDKLIEGNPGQIKALADRYLVVLDNTNLYVIDCSQPEDAPIELKYNDKQINCKSFDLNDNFLVTNTNGVVNLYSIDDGQLVEKRELNVNAKDLTPICVNLSGTVFFIENSTPSIISSYNSNSGPSKNQLYTSTGDVSHMIAREQTLYIIEGDKVKALSEESINQTATTLGVSQDQYNELGNLISPSSLSFKNESLFIADSSIGAVQEFEIQENTLVWTGFAIAKNKTAYNRFTDSICDVERTNDNLAILSGDRITVINLKDFNYLDKSAYLTLFRDSFGDKLPEDVAVGNTSLLATNNDGDEIYFYDFNAKQNATNPVKIELPNQINHIHDCCYQSGYYYVLIDVDNQYDIYKINELTKSVALINDVEDKSNPLFTVDVFGNFHVYSKNDGFLKLDSDLTGSVYALKTDGFYKLINGSFVRQLDAPNDLSLESFTIDFDKKDLYFIAQDNEFVYKTISLNNSAINGISVPTEYKVTDDHAIQDNLKAFTVEEGSNVYSIEVNNEKLLFNNLTNSEEYYLFVCDIESIGHSLLIGQNGLVLVSKSNLSVKQLETTQTNEIKYISTSVCAYYYPVIDEFSSYALTSQSEKIVLNKGQEIQVKQQLEILDNYYYFATFEYNGQTISGYIPVTFTVDELSVDTNFVTFTIESLKGVKVYFDSSLTRLATTLNKGTAVRLYSTNNGVAEIAYYDGENWVKAYVNQDAIQEKPNTTIRNVLIILALTACVCGSITFFVIRKKETY